MINDGWVCDPAFRSGAVMGFLLAGLGLLVLFILISVLKLVRFAMLKSFVTCRANDERFCGT